MAKYLAGFVFICVSISLCNATLQTVNGTIKISIGTTSACSDTVSIMNALKPVYEEYKRFLEVEFVPWGRTRRENGSLVCQFGVNDCWANRLHRCALNLLRGNQDAQMHYMVCEFTSPFPAFRLGSYLCAQSVGLNLINVDHCMTTTGNALEAPAESAAAQPMAIINFVPTIVFNDNIDIELHTQARTRLRSVICFALAADPSTGVTNCSI